MCLPLVSVTLGDFEQRIKERIEGVEEALSLARKFAPYAVRGRPFKETQHCGTVTSVHGAGQPFMTAKAPDDARSPVPYQAMPPGCAFASGPHVRMAPPPSGAHSSVSIGFQHPVMHTLLSTTLEAGGSRTLEEVVPLVLFDRFVRCCAEPCAQAAWLLQAESAVKAAAAAACDAVILSGAGEKQLRDLLVSGQFSASVAFAAATALLPYSTAVVASAFAAYAYGGCAGAWAGFLPRQQAELMLLEQARKDSANDSNNGPGLFLLRLSGSRACEIAVSYVAAGPPGPAEGHSRGGSTSGGCARSTALSGDGSTAHSSDSELRVVHEILQLSSSGSGFVLRGVEYPAPAQAICANRSFLKPPSLTASLAVVGLALPSIESVATVKNVLLPFDILLEEANREAERVLDDLRAESGPISVADGLPLLVDAMCGKGDWRAQHFMLDRLCNDLDAEPSRFAFPPGADARHIPLRRACPPRLQTAARAQACGWAVVHGVVWSATCARAPHPVSCSA